MATSKKKPAPPSSYSEQKRRLESKGNKAVTRPIPKLDAEIVAETSGKRKGGVRKYTPTRMKNAINRYFAWCEENDEIPTIKGLMVHLKMYRDTFYAYLKYPEFAGMLEHTRLIIADWCATDVYNTKGMAAGKIAYMKNIHDWSDKLETQNQNHTIVLTPEQARARIESLAPQLLEILNIPQVAQQITTRDGKTRPEIIEAEVQELQNPKRV